MDEMKSLAESGNASAQFSLGLFYYDSENYSQALFWFKKASEQGNAGAKIYSSICVLAGLGGNADASAF